MLFLFPFHRGGSRSSETWSKLPLIVEPESVFWAQAVWLWSQLYNHYLIVNFSEDNLIHSFWGGSPRLNVVWRCGHSCSPLDPQQICHTCWGRTQPEGTKHTNARVRAWRSKGKFTNRNQRNRVTRGQNKEEYTELTRPVNHQEVWRRKGHKKGTVLWTHIFDCLVDFGWTLLNVYFVHHPVTQRYVNLIRMLWRNWALRGWVTTHWFYYSVSRLPSCQHKMI